MLDRYPPGIDVDANGRILRVVSQNTYVTGMNIVSEDLKQCEEKNPGVKEILWSQAWDDWQVDGIDHFRRLQQQCNVADPPNPESSSLDALELWASATDLLSAGDVCFGFCMRKPNKVYASFLFSGA
jgi:hypothetical protein